MRALLQQLPFSHTLLLTLLIITPRVCGHNTNKETTQTTIAYDSSIKEREVDEESSSWQDVARSDSPVNSTHILLVFRPGSTWNTTTLQRNVIGVAQVHRVFCHHGTQPLTRMITALPAVVAQNVALTFLCACHTDSAVFVSAGRNTADSRGIRTLYIPRWEQQGTVPTDSRVYEMLYSLLGFSPPTVRDKSRRGVESPLGISYMLSPHTSESFFTYRYEKEHLYIPRHNSSYYQHIVSHDAEIEDLIRARAHHVNSNRVSTGTLRDAVVEDGFADLRLHSFADVLCDYCTGQTIVHNAVQEYWPIAAALAEVWSRELHYHLSINVFITPPGHRGFLPHSDHSEVFVLQIKGRKKWHLYDTPVQLPLLPQTSRHLEGYTPGDPSAVYTLEPGDLLYVPRGLVHMATCESSTYPCIHWSLVVITELQTWARFIRSSIYQDPRYTALSKQYPDVNIIAFLSWIEQDRKFFKEEPLLMRANVPRGFLHHKHLSHLRSTYQDYLEKIRWVWADMLQEHPSNRDHMHLVIGEVKGWAVTSGIHFYTDFLESYRGNLIRTMYLHTLDDIHTPLPPVPSKFGQKEYPRPDVLTRCPAHVAIYGIDDHWEYWLQGYKALTLEYRVMEKAIENQSLALQHHLHIRPSLMPTVRSLLLLVAHGKSITYQGLSGCVFERLALLNLLQAHSVIKELQCNLETH